jgi:hypothetical protein
MGDNLRKQEQQMRTLIAVIGFSCLAATQALAQQLPLPPKGGTDLATVLSHGYVPEFSHGTLAISQPPVNINNTPQGILTSVASTPVIAIGPDQGNNAPTSNVPDGYGAGTAYFLVRGIFHLRASNVTVPGTVTLDLQQKPIGSGTFGSFEGSSGISKPTVFIAVNPNQADYFVPIEVAVAGEPGNTSYGTFDVFVSQQGITATSLQIIAGGLQVMVWPTDTKVASYPQILEFVATGREKQLLFNVAVP